MELILIPNTKDNKKDQEFALKVCDWFSHGTPIICPTLAFSYRDRHDDWFERYAIKEIIVHCERLKVFCDEVTAMMIEIIKFAIEKKIPIDFYDADWNHIAYDALVINKRIGPGYRKMITMANGDIPLDGMCPHCGKPITKD